MIMLGVELKDGDVLRNGIREPLSVDDVETALKGKLIGIYFSANWCPPCREFTPVLKKFYEEVAGEGFEIIFVSADNSEEEQQEYLSESHGSYLYIKHGELTDKFSVDSIPKLVVCDEKGKIKKADASFDVELGKGVRVLSKWRKSTQGSPGCSSCSTM